MRRCARPLTASHPSPWLISHDGLNKFFIVAEQLDPCVTDTAASSFTATEYLAKFVKKPCAWKGGCHDTTSHPLDNPSKPVVRLRWTQCSLSDACHEAHQEVYFIHVGDIVLMDPILGNSIAYKPKPALNDLWILILNSLIVYRLKRVLSSGVRLT